MARYNNKIVVSFPGGAYGSYLLWLLYSLTTDEEIHLPFGENGNSHNAKKIANYLEEKWVTLTPDQLRTSEDLRLPKSCYLIKNHPKVKTHDKMQESLNTLCNLFDKVILLYPSKSSYLLNIHNYVYKTLQGNLFESPYSNCNLEDIYDNYPDAEGIKSNNLPQWILREYLSYYIFSSWEDQVEWYFPDRCKEPNIHVILIDNLLYDVENTLEKIKQIYNLTWTKNIEKVLPIHKQNLAKQMHLTQDNLCHTILKNYYNNDHYEWKTDDLTLISEAYLQKKLRDSGHELKCHNLNVFPTTTNELKELTL